MPPADPPAEPTQSASPADDEAYVRQTLRQMSELGMKLMRQADADPSLTIVQKADIFERVSRAVRRTILLEMHIAAQRTRAAPAPHPPRPTTDADIARANRTEPPDRQGERGERGDRVETVDLGACRSQFPSDFGRRGRIAQTEHGGAVFSDKI